MKQSERGLTLIEIAIVIAMMAVLISSASTLFSGSTRADLRHDALVLVSLFKKAQTTAVLSGRIVRVEFNLTESTVKQVALSKSDRYVPYGSEEDDDETEEDDDETEEVSFSSLQEEISKLEQADEGLDLSTAEMLNAFTATGDTSETYATEPQFEEVNLYADTRIQGVWVAGADKVIDEGIVGVHFFPSGEAQTAQVYVVSANDPYQTTFTVSIDPFEQKANVYAEALEIPKL